MNNTSEQWKFAAMGSNDGALGDKITKMFEDLYIANGRPNGMALFRSTQTDGMPGPMFMTPQSVKHCAPIFDVCSPWHDNRPSDIFNPWFAAGDESVVLSVYEYKNHIGYLKSSYEEGQ